MIERHRVVLLLLVKEFATRRQVKIGDYDEEIAQDDQEYFGQLTCESRQLFAIMKLPCCQERLTCELLATTTSRRISNWGRLVER